MIIQTVNALFDIMRPHFKGFPDNYLVIDVETTGINLQKDLITQLGYCLVRDGKPAEQAGIILDWTTMPQRFRHDALRQRMADTRRHVEFKDGVPTGKHYHMSFEKMASEGADPIAVLNMFGDILEDARQHGLFFIAHNGYHFDTIMIEGHLDHFAKRAFQFANNEVFDTGMVEKGAQCNSIPWANETVRDWSLRTYRERLRHVRWALDTGCVPRYGLAEKHGLDMEAAHDAGFDCRVTHHLFEEHKAIAAGTAIEPPPPVVTMNIGR